MKPVRDAAGQIDIQGKMQAVTSVIGKHPLWAAGAAVARGARIIPANGRRTRAAASPPAVAAIFPAGLKISR